MSETEERARVCAIAKTWIGTPFRDQGNVKGPNGAVDCAMMLVAVFQEAGLLDPAYDPRPYPPQFHLHRGEERFLKAIDGIIAARARGAEVSRAAIAGDVIVYRVARCFSHGGLVIENEHLIHAYYRSQRVAVSSLHEIELACLPDGKPRPFKLFDLWAHA
ncbi:MAG TPA: NlpC/P60 family protein [Rhizomicrobium sp.]|jgi:cell wall-associated NlpC family hydrolase|nr:NlpC/P60 family protein [Rhizomicrobium sp.]